ncbi:MAG: dTDP-4-dehydrorhamnose 3,5-epimerase [Chloroflexi bacterium]|nr:dTDP-4-dehydrorhamnose 3,5-epimerase [Chloroflexota bacterium]
MQVSETALPGVLVIEPTVHEDERGFFYESYNQRAYAAQGIADTFVQDNHSRSVRGVLRGLHYQAPPGQAKLVRVAVGAVFDVAVDVRWGSPTFGRWIGVELSAENRRQLYIPAGLAHGFCVLSEVAEFLYKVTTYYAPADERGILWSDPAIGIAWPVTAPILSDRDRRHPLLRDIPREYECRP